MDYSNGKIYKLICTNTGEFYIGSTCTSLAKRLWYHKKKSRESKQRSVYKHIFEYGGWDAVKIVLIQDITCTSKDELIREEQRYIDELKPSLNTNLATIYTKYDSLQQYTCEYSKTWRENNKSSISDYRKQYYQNNRDKEAIKAKTRYEKNKLIKVQCPQCHKEMKKSNLSNHVYSVHTKIAKQKIQDTIVKHDENEVSQQIQDTS